MLHVVAPTLHQHPVRPRSTACRHGPARPGGGSCPAVPALRASTLLGFALSGFVLINVFLLIAVWTPAGGRGVGVEGGGEGGADGGGGTWRHGSNSRQTFVLTRQYAEQIGLCDRVQLDGDISAWNRTVLRICREIRRDEAVFYRRRSEKVNPFSYRFLLDGRELCTKDTDVVVLVHSLHSYEERRRAIRATWGDAVKNDSWPGGSPIRHNVSVGFVLGYHRNNSWNIRVYNENRNHKDLIMGDFIEDYKNMTLKSLLGLKWVAEHCPNVKYLIKSDDDMIINFPHLFNVLDGADMRHAIIGPYNVGSRVLRKGKWNLSRKVFPFYYYPPYESGACYVISGDLVNDLYETSEYVPWIFIDDVYITGIVGKVIGVRHLRRNGFAFWNSPKPKLCDLVENKVLTGTRMRTAYLRTLWENLGRNPVCPIPTAPGRHRKRTVVANSRVP